MDNVFVRESLLQESTNGKIRCNVCERRCTIVPGGYGWCRTRQNQGGHLVTLIYGMLSSVAAEPIEKKPFYHFLPGTRTLTSGSWSCNFGCPWCQNWRIARVPPPERGRYVSPWRFVELAERTGCQGVSISYNEPTLSLEWSLDVFRLAHKHGLYTTCVTNGYLTPEAFLLLKDSGLDAMNVDLKGDAAAVRQFCKGVDVNQVCTLTKLAHARGVHVEMTTLVIPTVNDTTQTLREIAGRIVNDLGPDVPWHVSGYFPAYKFTVPPTPVATLKRAWHIGKRAGLKFVYLGNVPDHQYSKTECPGCGALLIRRFGYEIVLNKVRAGGCPECEQPVPGVWEWQPMLL